MLRTRTRMHRKGQPANLQMKSATMQDTIPRRCARGEKKTGKLARCGIDSSAGGRCTGDGRHLRRSRNGCGGGGRR